MNKSVTKVTHFIHKYFLPLLLVTYTLAATFPQIGLAMRQLSFGDLATPGLGTTRISISLAMLSFLLFNAGLGIKTSELLKLRNRPQLLIVGFLANMVIPIVLSVCLRIAMTFWHNDDEVQNLMVGLALIIAMPIAGSAAAWAQNANGNLSLSLGLILLSTFLSPLTTPAVLQLFSFMTQGDYAEDLSEMASADTNVFLCLTVVFPSLAGMALHYIAGEERIARIKPYLKLANFLVLLLLNYSNASISLPQVVAKPDWDLLVLILTVTALICTVSFFAGWLVSKGFRADNSDKAALMFSLGMNNNGTGLVLAATALADHPDVMLPMIFYTLVQQVIAAIVDFKIFKTEE